MGSGLTLVRVEWVDWRSAEVDSRSVRVDSRSAGVVERPRALIAGDASVAFGLKLRDLRHACRGSQ